ncbi:MAG: hypothetical protein ACLRUM_00510 [Veillonella parvula]
MNPIVIFQVLMNFEMWLKKILNKAVLLGFDNTINHLIEQHLSIYPLTILGRNDVLKSCK